MDLKYIGGLLAWQIWDTLDVDDEEERLYDLSANDNDSVDAMVPHMEDHQFELQFRMNRTTFEDFLAKISAVNPYVIKRGQVEVPIEKRCLMTIWCLANGECFRSVADRFDISISTCWKLVYQTCEDILKINKKFKIVHWPSAERAQATSDYFEEKTRLPGVIGCIDSLHIKIRAPKEFPNSYVNSEGYHSLLLQAVCDERFMFIDCYAGEAGSIDDDLLFQRSDLNAAIQRGTVQFPNNSFIVGTTAHPLEDHLVTPFADNGSLSNQQMEFNTNLSTIRQSIEGAFTLLQNRFRRLEYLENLRLDLSVLLIISSCILHNICMLHKDCFPQDTDDQDEDLENEEHPAKSAIAKRNKLANQIWKR